MKGSSETIAFLPKATRLRLRWICLISIASITIARAFLVTRPALYFLVKCSSQLNLKEYQPNLSTYIAFLMREAFYNFSIVQIQIETLAFLKDGLFAGCVACPRPSESGLSYGFSFICIGSLYLAADGNFSLFRYANTDTGVQNRRSELKDFFFVNDEGIFITHI